MAVALYRKYRPATFAEVVGQDHVTEPLIQAVDNGRINHAYLFSGPRGCGKTSSARILARSLNCVQGPTSTPCGICDSCVGLAPDGAGTPDVIEIDAASHGGVDDARDLRDRAFYAPMVSRYKIYIIDEAHMVTTQGFNALLKLVEEPPDFLVFVFATTEPDKVLPTIRSRTHHYPFRLMAPSVLRGLLGRICEEEKATVEDSVFPLVVRAGGGSARDALSILDQLLAGAGEDGVTYRRAVGLLGVTDGALLDETIDALAAGDAGGVFGAVDRVSEAGHDPRRFTADLLDRLRDLVILDAVPDAAGKGMLDLPADQLTTMADQAARIGTATLSRFADIVHDGLTDMRGTTAPRLLLELLCARMLLPSASADASATLQRLERLERRMQIADLPSSAPRPAQPERPQPEPAAQPTTTSARTRPAVEPLSTPGREASTSASRRTAEPAVPAAAPPAAVPDSSTQPSPTLKPAADLTVVDLRRLWPDILESIKQRKRTTAALLMSANVLAVEGSVLKLGINSSGLMRRLSEEMNTEIIRAALADKLGVDWQVQTVVDAGEEQQSLPTTDSAAVAAADGSNDVGAIEEVGEPDPGGSTEPIDSEQAALSLLREELGAQPVDGQR
ncbi:MAG: DNA polymerase III subunit gamma and tau [Actinomycetota bacterium]|nr:DNA polymerase III subunit gamma and tau [Actinomycetota bacterium]